MRSPTGTVVGVCIVAILSIAGPLGIAAQAPSAQPPARAKTGPTSSPPTALTEWPSPAASGSMAPRFAVSHDGRLYLSWLEPAAPTGWRFRIAERTGNSWNQLPDIAQGVGLVANWEDGPSVFASSGGTLAAHWLQKTGTRSGGYGIRMRVSLDRGRTWSTAVTPHRDDSPTEHGFLSFFDAPDGTIGVVWLDGRETAAGAAGSHGRGGGATALRATTLAPGLALGADQLVDGRVCDCCQTAAARTSRGVIVAYRDRSEQEIRDIGVARLDRGPWKLGGVLHPDGWKIAACPVNGPALASNGDAVALAWFTAAGDQGRVKVTISRDGGGTFGAPVRVDDEGALGRVDVDVLPDGSAMVLWIEFAHAKADLRMRRIWPDGRRGESIVVSPVGADRSSGNPRLARRGTDLVVAWRTSGAAPHIKIVAAKVPADAGSTPPPEAQRR